MQDCRFPVQYVIRPQTNENRDFRDMQEELLLVFKKGDVAVALPSGRETVIESILLGEEEKEIALH